MLVIWTISEIRCVSPPIVNTGWVLVISFEIFLSVMIYVALDSPSRGTAVLGTMSKPLVGIALRRARLPERFDTNFDIERGR